MQPDRVTWLGHQGENGARMAIMDIGLWPEIAPCSTVSLLIRRNGDETAYPFTPEVSGSKVEWILRNTDTAKAGVGQVEVQFRVDDILVKSCVYSFIISPNIGDISETAPEPYQTWLQQVLTANAGKLDKPVTKSFTIRPNDWLTSQLIVPYTHFAYITTDYTIGENTVCELINDNALLFARHGFAFDRPMGQILSVLSIGCPSEPVTLEVDFYG